ncbi:hypothetical protein [Microbacterium sp. AG157]|uniref:hypothetical protein n=1 Tax=Microbacterium sp. AG157 TaxID=2183993 RepID=UPI00216314FB|nr:hypothetical protein [Microbacterium sp. AG157]
MNNFKPEWQGTPQHSDASDLSRWLVHLTRSEADLISILSMGVIEARQAYGIGSSLYETQPIHRSVCLTEVPLHELRRMTRRRPWGIVFDKERLRRDYGAQPVWYVNNPSPQRDALRVAMRAAMSDPSAPIWRLTPFIEDVRDRHGSAPNDWRWEREWRVQGNLEFSIADVSMLVTDEGGRPAFLDDVSLGEVLYVSSGDSTLRWSGGFGPAWDKTINKMLQTFGEAFVRPEDGGFIWDREEQQYYGMVELVDTVDAMGEVFGQLSPDLEAAIAPSLRGVSDHWCRVSDLMQAYDY